MADGATEDKCPNCGKFFEKKIGGYKRSKIGLSFTPKTAKTFFPTIDVNSLVCEDCIKLKKAKTAAVKGSKKRRVSFSPRKLGISLFSPSRKSQDCKRTHTHKKNAAPSFWDYIKQFKYKEAFRRLIKTSPSGKEAIVTVAIDMIKNEIRSFGKQGKDTIFSQELSQKNLSAFSWGSLISEAKTNLPITVRAIEGLFPRPKDVAKQVMKGSKKYKRKMTEAEADEVVHSRMGLMLSMALFTRSLRKYKFVQSCIGVEMWRQQCTENVFKTFNSFGICQSVGAARAHVDLLGKHHTDEIMQWKSDVEIYTKSQAPDDARSDKTVEPLGYTVGWDNVQVNVHAKHESLQANRFLTWGLSFAVQNRVHTVHLSSKEVTDSLQLSPYCFLPTPDDYRRLKDRMVFVVCRILADNLKVLSSTSVHRHMPHAFSAEMKQPSNVVNLGLVDANPSSTEGVIKIMHHLQEFVPVTDETYFPILANVDNLSVERMRMSRRANINALSSKGRLEGLEETPQEFHKEALLLQDTMNALWKSPCHSRGTVGQMKVYFGHKSLKKKVFDNFKHSFDMIRFCTEGYISLLACRVTDIKTLDGQPAGFPLNGSKKQKTDWVHRLAQTIVDSIWCPIEMEDIRQAADAFKQHDTATDIQDTIFPFCICETDMEEDMLCCNSNCLTQWFHASCVNGATPVEDEDWYCSTECDDSHGYIYCLCQSMKSGGMIQCSLKSNCKRSEWYHLSCLGLKKDLPDMWCCSEECALGAEDDDCVLNYSKSVIWEGLNLLVRHDAVREGDGPEIVSHWKLDLLNFWMKKHNKYFISACQFLAGTSGFLGERLKQDLTWNRLANLKGGPAGNIGLDLVNEFLNRDFKEMLKHCHGRYTTAQVERVAQMSGAFGGKLDHLFTVAGLGDLEASSTCARTSWLAQDVATFVRDFHDDALVDYLPVREHKGFQSYRINKRLHEPRRMGAKIAKWAGEMDFWRTLHADFK